LWIMGVNYDGHITNLGDFQYEIEKAIKLFEPTSLPGNGTWVLFGFGLCVTFGWA
jgi:hypothetical protein